ncbi:DUF6036 family nucleotidyltransferase [Vibrio spartinae]|uniref:DUF6036 domain-containing protein n=1 Tax=Vibrio spartinae TaxID=1918945 RepID=A0A1N6M215_9VIBR|nr:DUF6036 family nucleotidyltransferase [Vibrio spartinae]SIO93452.1 hypothetical protein VSP9026_01119 [Vibrio spartinae]
MKPLHKNTPLAKAVFNILSEISNIAEDKYGALPSGTIRAFIFGGCAVHIYTNARGSNDLDVELEASRRLDISELIVELDDADYDDEDGTHRTLTFDDTFNPAIPDLHPDWRDDSILIQSGEAVIHIYLVSAVDIAISKLGRCTSYDVNDIVSLYVAERFSIEAFAKRACEALYYSPTPDRLRYNIAYATQVLKSI